MTAPPEHVGCALAALCLFWGPWPPVLFSSTYSTLI